MAGKISQRLGAQDMTVGSPASALIQFSIPLLLGNLAQQLYNTVDSIVVGKYVGDTALAAVGASGPILNLILVLFMGISTGANIMVSQYFGAKQREELSKTVGTAITLTFLCSLFIMLLGTFSVDPLLRLLDTPENIYQGAHDYLTIFFFGIIGCAYYNIISGILRGLGDSITPLIFLLVACALNIGLDLLFVALLQWGVAGVAWATVIAQAISAFFCFLRMLSMHETMRLKLRALIPSKRLLSQLIKLGLPSGLTQMVFSMAAIIVQSLTNSFETDVIACSTVVMRVDGFAMMPNFTFGIAMTTFTGQNLGAGKLDRVHRGAKDGLKIGVAASVALTLCILLFGGFLASMFTNTQQVIFLAIHMMQILAVGYIAMGVTQILSGVMRGAGDTLTPMWISLVTTVVIRVPLAYGIAYLTRSDAQPNGTPDCLFISLLVSWVLGAVFTAICYFRGKWRKKADATIRRIAQTAQQLEEAEPVPY